LELGGLIAMRNRRRWSHRNAAEGILAPAPRYPLVRGMTMVFGNIFGLRHDRVPARRHTMQGLIPRKKAISSHSGSNAAIPRYGVNT